MQVLNATVQPAIKDQLEKFAAQRGITVSDALRRLLETHPDLQSKRKPQ